MWSLSVLLENENKIGRGEGRWWGRRKVVRRWCLVSDDVIVMKDGRWNRWWWWWTDGQNNLPDGQAGGVEGSGRKKVVEGIPLPHPLPSWSQLFYLMAHSAWKKILKWRKIVCHLTYSVENGKFPTWRLVVILLITWKSGKSTEGRREELGCWNYRMKEWTIMARRQWKPIS